MCSRCVENVWIFKSKMQLIYLQWLFRKLHLIQPPLIAYSTRQRLLGNLFQMEIYLWPSKSIMWMLSSVGALKVGWLKSQRVSTEEMRHIKRWRCTPQYCTSENVHSYHKAGLACFRYTMLDGGRPICLDKSDARNGWNDRYPSFINRNWIFPVLSAISS